MLGRLAGAIVIVLACVSVEPATAAPEPGGVRCSRLDFSPNFSRDRTAVCAALPTNQDTSQVITVALTRDGGRTWTSRPALGVPVTPFTWLNTVLFSSNYAEDRTIYLQTGEGLYRSQDDAERFLPVDPLAGTASVVPNLTRLPGITLPTGPLPKGILSPPIAMANPDELMPSAILSPPLHLPVLASPDSDLRFLVAPEGSGPHAGKIFSAAVRIESDSTRLVLYGCSSALTCTEELHLFPPKHEYQGSHLPADFARTGIMYLWSKEFGSRLVTLWRSTDGGATFAPWAGGNAILKQPVERGFPRLIHLGLTSDPRRSSRMYLRVAGISGIDPPAQQLWRSEDSGRRWQLMGFTRYTQPIAKGTLPWLGENPYAERGNILAAPNGNLFVLVTGSKHGPYSGVYCSTDGARTWERSCR